MTPVRFKFLTPLGVPIADTPFYVSLNKAALNSAEHGFVHPEVVEGLTDAQGEATLTLFPANQPYYVTMDTSAVINDEQRCAAIRFRIAVPASATEVWADNLVVTDPIFSQPWDAEAIEVIMQAKAAAAASATEAKVSETAAKASEVAAAASAVEAASAAAGVDQSAAEAAAAAAAALASEQAADLSATGASASAAAALLSEQSASSSANSALSSANTATTAADAAQASATAAAGSATNSANSATAANQSKLDAAASAVSAGNSASAAATSAGIAQTAQAAAEVARDEAVAAAGSVAGVISDLGAWDASTGVYPNKPANGSAFWKVTANGTVGGIAYGVGDTLMYSNTLDEFYKIDNTESVSSVNGKTGTVVITKGDVGLDIGLGAYNAQSGADLNTYTIPGTLVSTAAGATNSPISVIGGYLRVVGGVNASLASQVWTEQVGNQVGYTPRSWSRSLYTAGNWSPWSLTIAGSNWLPLTTSTDADLLTDANVTYHVQGSTVTNLPLATTGFLRVLFRGDSGGAALRCIQEYTPYEPANGSSRVWRRTRDESNVWSAWFRTDTGALGTAAMGTLTTSVTDTTTGRVLKVGDFGVGGMVPSLGAVNLDTVDLMSGSYYVAGPSNGPSGFSGFGFLCVTRLGGTTSQVLTSYVDGRTYKRARPDTGQAWTAWKEAVFRGDLGIGGQAPILADLAAVNALGPNDQGFFTIVGSVAGALGIPKSYGGVILHYGRAGDTAVQQYTSTGTNDVQVYTRTYNTVTIGWSPWVKNFTSLDAPTSTLNGLTGQLVRLGDYGYGGYVPQLNESQINAQRMGGFYYVGGQGLGILPVNTNGYLTVETVSAVYSKQTFTHYTDGRMWSRVCIDNAWSGWAKLNNPVKSMGSEVNDLNNTTNGIQMFNTDFANIPPTIGFGVVQSMWRGPTECIQYAWSVTSDNVAMRRLLLGSGGWSAWRDMTPFGVGQNWGPNLQGSRAYDTDYTNNTGRTIMVQVFAGATVGTNVGLSVITGGTSIIGQYAPAAGSYISVGPVAVAPGATYRVSQRNGTAPINTWAEFR